jgi:hypothetical protein
MKRSLLVIWAFFVGTIVLADGDQLRAENAPAGFEIGFIPFWNDELSVLDGHLDCGLNRERILGRVFDGRIKPIVINDLTHNVGVL